MTVQPTLYNIIEKAAVFVKIKNFTFVLAVIMIVGLAVYGIYWNVDPKKTAFI